MTSITTTDGLTLRTRADEPAAAPRARVIVLHGIGDQVDGVPYVTAAAALAGEIQEELAACQTDPFLTSLLRPDLPGAASEWLLEDRPQPGIVCRGVIDRLAFDGQTWWLLDFKTSRPAPGEDWAAFITRETEKYRPQLLAYREMAAKAKGIAPPEIMRLGIYFTACRKVVEV